MLGKHAVIGKKFTIMKSMGKASDCEEFKVNTYYYAECDKLKNPEKYEKK
jgi:hypothetical protein